MAVRLLESRFANLTVNDENEPNNVGPVYQKSKVKNNYEPLYQISFGSQATDLDLNYGGDCRPRLYKYSSYQYQPLKSP